MGIRYHTQQRDHRETEKNLVGEIKYSTKIRKGLVLVIFLVLSILFLTLLSVVCTSSTYAQSGDPLVLTDYLSNPEMARSKAKIDASTIGYVSLSLSPQNISSLPFF